MQYVGRDSVIKEGNVSSVDSKPELYLCEAFHCIQPYYWCEVCRSVLGVGQQRFCALSGQSGHLRNESAKPSCVCLCVREIQAVLQCGREDWAMAFVLSGQRSRRVKHSCPVQKRKKHIYRMKTELFNKRENRARERIVYPALTVFFGSS